VLNFNPKNGLAVAFQRQRPGDRSSPLREGVVHRSGVLRVPCAFARSSAASTIRPQGLPRRQTAGLHPEGQPMSSAPRATAGAPALWCPPLARIVQKNALLAGMGSGPEAEMGWFSFKDFSFTPPAKPGAKSPRPCAATSPGQASRSARPAPQRSDGRRRHGLDAGRGRAYCAWAIPARAMPC
jgi:hypothetical protein